MTGSRARTGDAGGVVHEICLSYRPPLAFEALVDFLGRRSVPGVEQVVDGTYRRVVRLPGGPAVVTLAPGRPAGRDAPWLMCRLHVPETQTGSGPRARSGPGQGDVDTVAAAVRRLADLDADPVTIDATLGADPALAPLVAAVPGRRAPVHVDPEELAVRAVLGQQVSLAAARRLAGQLAELCGEPLDRPVGGLTVAFPTPAAIAEADLGRLGMPGARRATLRALAGALASGEISLAPDADPAEAERTLLAVRGIGPWTAAYIRMRGLGDPDVLLTSDLGVRHALDRLGIDGATRQAAWRPWRSYAVHHLWAGLG
jgi:AraC family transcriptional regulator, regulatory protein of adaptative response / DNA-3-methyladenine glycosylase II